MDAPKNYQEALEHLALIAPAPLATAECDRVGAAQAYATLAVADALNAWPRYSIQEIGPRDESCSDEVWPPRHGDIWRDRDGEKWLVESNGLMACLTIPLNEVPNILRESLGPLWLERRPNLHADLEPPF